MGKKGTGFRAPSSMDDLADGTVVSIRDAVSYRPRDICGVLKTFTIENGVVVYVICHAEESICLDLNETTGVARIDGMVAEACAATGLPYGLAVFDMDATEQFILKIMSVKEFLKSMRAYSLIDSFRVSDKIFCPVGASEKKEEGAVSGEELTTTSVTVGGVRYTKGFIDHRSVGNVLKEIETLAEKMRDLLVQVKRHNEYFPDSPAPATETKPAETAPRTWYQVTFPATQMASGTKVRFKLAGIKPEADKDVWHIGTVQRSWNFGARETIFAVQHDVPEFGAPSPQSAGHSRVTVMRFLTDNSSSMYPDKDKFAKLLSDHGFSDFESEYPGTQA